MGAGLAFGIGGALILEETFDGLSGDLYLHLISSATPPAATDNAPYPWTELVHSGYAPVVITSGEVTINGFTTGSFGNIDAQEWTLAAYGSASTTIYGWWLDYINGSTTIPLWGGPLTTPYLIPAIGSSFVLGPIQISQGNCSPGGASGGSASFANPGFELPVITPATFNPAPTWPAGSWTGTGILASAGCAYEPPSGNPEGSQYAILQGTSSLSQVVSVPVTADYKIQLSVAQRTFGTSQSVAVAVDGTTLATIGGITTAWKPYYSPSFNLAAGNHTISFTGTQPFGPDASMFIDGLALTAQD